MRQTWQEDPNKRPCFKQLVQELDYMLTLSLKDEVRALFLWDLFYLSSTFCMTFLCIDTLFATLI